MSKLAEKLEQNVYVLLLLLHQDVCQSHYASSQPLRKDGRGKFSKYSPFAFTEQGIAMLASVLRSPKAIEVNIQIVRAFVFLRKYALSHAELTQKLQELEAKYNKQFKDVFEAINFLLQKDKVETNQKQRKQIGFK